MLIYHQQQQSSDVELKGVKMRFRVLIKLLVAALVATIPGVMVTAPSSAIGTTTWTSPQWKKILKEANGQTVNWYMWGGSTVINDYVNDVIGAEAAKFGVKLNQVKLSATADAVNKVLGEKQAGNLAKGSVDMIWINGENFLTGKQANIWHCDWATKLPNAKHVDWTSPAINLDFGLPVDGCEAPWARATAALVYDSAKVKAQDVKSSQTFVDWVKKNPGQYTYPAPPDFNGSMTVRRWAYHANGSFEPFMGAFDQGKYNSASKKAFDFLNDLKPSLWRKGSTYPASIGELEKLYANGEISAYISYGASTAPNQVEKGLYPKSTRVAAWADGQIGNTNYVTIPFNSPNKAAAYVVANIINSPQAQYLNAKSLVLDSPAIEMHRTVFARQMRELPVKQSGISIKKLQAVVLPEPNGTWLKAIDAGWIKDVQQK